MTPEGKVKAMIDRLLDGREDTWFFKPVQSGYGKRALDYIGCTLGHFWAIEAKREGKEPTPFQRITANSIWNAGGKVFKISNEEGVNAFSYWLSNLK